MCRGCDLGTSGLQNQHYKPLDHNAWHWIVVIDIANELCGAGNLHVTIYIIAIIVDKVATTSLQLLGDVPEEEDAEDAELQASIASANKWRKIAALTRQRAAEVHCMN